MKYLSFEAPSLPIVLSLYLLITCISVPSAVFAGEWRVIPIRLDFSPKVKSGVLTVKNTGDEALHVSVAAKNWSQDEVGKDQYDDTSEMIFFPKVLMIRPNSERVVRVGVKAPAVKQEKAYRVFITESKAPTKNSSQVAVALRVGIPVFAKPLEENIAGGIDDIELSDGAVSFKVRNLGNTHFRTTKLDVIGKNQAGQQVFTQELKGWYLLPGKDQPHKALIPLNVRSQLATIDIKIVTDRMELFKSVAFDGAVKVPLKVE